MRPSCWRWSLTGTALVALVALMAGSACSVDAPALDCVRASQCRLGRICQAGRCVLGSQADSAGDSAGDSGSDVTEDTGDDSAPEDYDEDAEDSDADAAADAPDSDAAADAPDIPVEDTADTAEDVPPDLPSLDPAPERTAPGEFGCEGGSDVNLDGAEPDVYSFLRTEAEGADAFAISGVVTGTNHDGTWYVRQPRGGQAIGTFVTNANGSFRAVVPTECNAVDHNVVKLVWPDDGCDLVVVLNVQTPICRSEDVHVGLWWNLEGDDLDLHLVREGGQINRGDDDCNSANCISGSPDWGPIGLQGNPRKDFDAGSGGGPENIVITAGASGTYTIAVERWGESADAPSDAIIIASMDGQPRVTMTTQLRPRSVWLAAEVDYEQRRWMPLSDVVDCSADWNETTGCMLTLP